MGERVDKKDKKMTKRIPSHWKFSSYGYILSLVVLFAAEVCTSDEANAVALQEAREAREAAERKVVQLEIELEQSRKALEKTRSRYADLYLRGHGLLRSLRQTELQVANLWHNRESSSSDAMVAQLLESLALAGKRQLEVVKSLDRFEGTLRTLVDVLQPSKALRNELRDRLQELRNSVDKSVRPLAMVSRTHGQADARRGCKVISVDEELQLVLLDGGALGGVAPESHWSLTVANELKATFIVVDVRPELSAAVMLKGTLTDVPVGSILRPVEGAR